VSGRFGARRAAEPSRSGAGRRLVVQLPVVRRTVTASAAVGLVSTATVVVQAVALAHLLAGAMPGAHPGDRLTAFVALGAAAAVRGLAALVGETLAHLGATKAKADLRAQLVGAALARAPSGDAGGPGDLATVAGRGLDALDVYIGRCLPDLVLAVVAPLALAVAVGVLDWISGVIVVTAIVLFPVFGALVGRASLALAGNRWRQVEGLGRHITDVFEGLPILRAFDRTAEQRRRIETAGEALREASLSTLRTAFLSALVLDTLASVSVALLAVPLGLRLLNGTVGLPAALAVLIVAPEVFLPLRRASAEFHESTEGLAALGQAMALIGPGDPSGVGRAPRGERRLREIPDPVRVPVELRAVRFEVTGRHDPILDGADLTIAPGETVVVVGPNGTGKSTVAALLLGFVQPSRGAVTVGGVDLADLDPASWRERVTYLPERPALLGRTLAENLRLADPEASEEAPPGRRRAPRVLGRTAAHRPRAHAAPARLALRARRAHRASRRRDGGHRRHRAPPSARGAQRLHRHAPPRGRGPRRPGRAAVRGQVRPRRAARAQRHRGHLAGAGGSRRGGGSVRPS
jgi:ABC-type transport system involved in cytochrome bd biosynthesis fused ATPase/permease subunit